MKKFRKLVEQHREAGRFKPTIPRIVKSVGVGPRPDVDSSEAKLKEASLDKPTPSVEEIAKKHNVSVEAIEKQLEMGLKVEKEHTTNDRTAREIALDHLNEKPNYYSKLKKYIEMTDVEYQSAGSGGKTLVDKPNREPMKTLKQFNKKSSMNEAKDDDVGEMVKDKLKIIIDRAQEVHDGIDNQQDMPEWIKSKITLAQDYISTVADYMHTSEVNEEKENVHDAIKKIRKEETDRESEVKKNIEQTKKTFPNVKHFTKSGHPDWKKHGYKDMPVKEETEQIDEISKDLARSYYGKAQSQVRATLPSDDAKKREERRKKGIESAKTRIHAKEEAEQIDEIIAPLVAGAARVVAAGASGAGRLAAGAGRAIGNAVRKTGSTAGKAVLGAGVATNKVATSIANKNNSSSNSQNQKNESVENINELSTELLGRYKTAATAQASAADKAKDFAKGNKRFSGIVKATKKQFANASMKKEEVEQLDEIGNTAKGQKRLDKVLDRATNRILKNKGEERAKAEKTAGRAWERLNKEEAEYLEEKNKPTNPELWSRAVSMAKQKFDVYPSAYANGWAAKWYKSKGGGWKSVSEEVDLEENQVWKGHSSTVKNPNFNDELSIRRVNPVGKRLKSGKLSADERGSQDRLKTLMKFTQKRGGLTGPKGKLPEEVEQVEEQKEPPFEPSKTTKKAIPGKHGSEYSTVRHLARTALKRQAEKMKPVKESLEESRKAEIVKEIMKKKKNEMSEADKFVKEPILSDTITKE